MCRQCSIWNWSAILSHAVYVKKQSKRKSVLNFLRAVNFDVRNTELTNEDISSRQVPVIVHFRNKTPIKSSIIVDNLRKSPPVVTFIAPMYRII